MNGELLNNLLAKTLEMGEKNFQMFLDYLPIIKVVAGIFSVICLIAIIYLISKINLFWETVGRIKENYSFSDLSEKRVLKAWKEIEEKMKGGRKTEMKLAIIEADRVLDEVLKVAGYKGETIAERMEKVTPAQLTNIDKVWRAHKIRNRIVHESEFNISEQEVEEVIKTYKKAFQEFGLIRE